MKSLIAFMCLLAVAFASECGPLQRLKVKRQWAEAYGSGNGREEFGHFIWAKWVDSRLHFPIPIPTPPHPHNAAPVLSYSHVDTVCPNGVSLEPIDALLPVLSTSIVVGSFFVWKFIVEHFCANVNSYFWYTAYVVSGVGQYCSPSLHTSVASWWTKLKHPA